MSKPIIKILETAKDVDLGGYQIGDQLPAEIVGVQGKAYFRPKDHKSKPAVLQNWCSLEPEQFIIVLTI